MSRLPFCVDCIHRSKLLGSDMCNRPRGGLDLTTGKPGALYKLCTIERMEPYKIFPHITCDKEGKFFHQNTSVWYRIKKWVSSLNINSKESNET